MDLGVCLKLLGFNDVAELSRWQNAAIEERHATTCRRDLVWTQSVAVGDADFLEQVAHRLGNRGRFKVISDCPQIEGLVLREDAGLFLGQKTPIKASISVDL